MSDEREVSKLEESLRSFAGAYPEDIFLPLTDEQIKEHSTVITRASATMGRHCGTFFVQAADRIAQLEREKAELRRTLVEARNALELANNGYNRVIIDTIWMPEGISLSEALFDYIDAAIEKFKAIERTPSQEPE